MPTYSTRITDSYSELRSLYLGIRVRRDARLNPGKVTLVHADDSSFALTGALDSHGFVTGMARLYRYLNLRPGMTIDFEVTEDGTLIITAPPPPSTEPGDEVPAELEPVATSVFERKGLKHVHFEPFRPENLNQWQPETETDVFLAFGVLQDYTDYQYCCGTSKAVLEKLGADYSETAKPDAILVDRITDQYMMAEWKKASAEYRTNHLPEDVDILVCWEDNETDRSKLPPRVIALRSIAQRAAEKMLDEGA